MALGRPKSLSASMAARTVRPLNRTSSTRMTVLPPISNGMVVGADMLVDVVSVHADIQATGRDGLVPEVAQQARQAAGQMHAAARDAHQDNGMLAVVPLGNFVRDACQRPFNCRRVQKSNGSRHKRRCRECCYPLKAEK